MEYEYSLELEEWQKWSKLKLLVFGHTKRKLHKWVSIYFSQFVIKYHLHYCYVVWIAICIFIFIPKKLWVVLWYVWNICDVRVDHNTEKMWETCLCILLTLNNLMSVLCNCTVTKTISFSSFRMLLVESNFNYSHILF